MRFARRLWLLLLLGVASVSAAGDIQVLCAPGLRVFLDGEFVGTSNAREDGLFLEGVPPGKHTVRVEKDQFLPRSYQVEVARVPIEVRVEELVPQPETPVESEPTIAATKEEILGSLVITSAPQNCTFEIDGRAEEKTIPQLTFGGLAAGEHSISFSKPGYASVSAAVKIEPGAVVKVRGDLRAGKVEVVHEGKGSLRLISKPNRCAVRFLGKTRNKTERILNLSHLPAGGHPLVVSIPGRQLSTSVLIMNGRRTIIEVSFMKGDEPFVVEHEPEREDAPGHRTDANERGSEPR
jgi:hypothetical protein